MSFTDVMGGFGQNFGLQSNLAQNTAMNQQNQLAAQQQQASLAAQQAQLASLYGPQGFGGQTAQYAGAGAAYGRGTGYYGDTSGLPPGMAPLPNGQNGIPGGYPSGVVTSAPMPGVQLDPTPGVGGGAGYWGMDNQGNSGWYPGGGDSSATPQQLYSNGGFNPYDPNTFAGMAGIPGGMPQMLGTGSGGYDPQWGGSSVYSKGAQAVPSDWNNWFGQFQGTTGGGPNDYTSGGGWEKEYLLGNQDVFNAAKASGQDPIKFADQHFRDYGQNEGRGVFDAAEYLRENPDVAAAGVNPFQHFNQYGREEGRAEPMTGAFDPMMYRLLNQDVADAGVDPTAHWLQYGKNEGRAGGFAPSNAALGTGANYDFSNALVGQRADLANMIRNDPGLSLKYAARLNSEDQNNPATRVAIMEAMMNAYNSMGRDPMNPKYYPSEGTSKYTAALGRVSRDNNLLNSIYQEMEQAFGGSNTSNYATDWASDTPKYPLATTMRQYATPTYTSPSNEQFFRKDFSTDTGSQYDTGPGDAAKIQKWYQSLTGPPL